MRESESGSASTNKINQIEPNPYYTPQEISVDDWAMLSGPKPATKKSAHKPTAKPTPEEEFDFFSATLKDMGISDSNAFPDHLKNNSISAVDRVEQLLSSAKMTAYDSSQNSKSSNLMSSIGGLQEPLTAEQLLDKIPDLSFMFARSLVLPNMPLK